VIEHQFEVWLADDQLVLQLAGPAPSVAQSAPRGAQECYDIEAATTEEAVAILHLREGFDAYRPCPKLEQCPRCDAWSFTSELGECWSCGFGVVERARPRTFLPRLARRVDVAAWRAAVEPLSTLDAARIVPRRRTFEVWETDASNVCIEAGSASRALENEPGARKLFEFRARTGEEMGVVFNLRMLRDRYTPMGGSGPCPHCGACIHPHGSGDCWRCGHRDGE
jgi:ribosomal protein L37E